MSGRVVRTGAGAVPAGKAVERRGRLNRAASFFVDLDLRVNSDVFIRSRHRFRHDRYEPEAAAFASGGAAFEASTRAPSAAELRRIVSAVAAPG